jgi:hypothetical protein
VAAEVVARAVAAAGVAAAVVAREGDVMMDKRQVISPRIFAPRLVAGLVGTLALVGLSFSPAFAEATSAEKPAAKAPAQKAFATPDEAFQALVDASKADDSKQLAALFGPGGREIVDSGDPTRDKNVRAQFVSDYAKKHSVRMDTDAKATLVIGDTNWPMPVPVVKGSRGWTFDGVAGSRELLARRIGNNELDAIQVVQAIIDAQRDFASVDRNGDGVLEYAQRILSTSGKKDGLYWPTSSTELPSPLGPLVAYATGEGYKGKSSESVPFHGYYYRLLSAQGKDAPGGAHSYLVRGRMIGGVAVVAFPARYGNSGIMTFMADQDGVVYQKDLGANTDAAARAIKSYNPDKTWTKVAPTEASGVQPPPAASPK